MIRSHPLQLVTMALGGDLAAYPPSSVLCWTIAARIIKTRIPSGHSHPILNNLSLTRRVQVQHLCAHWQRPLLCRLHMDPVQALETVGRQASRFPPVLKARKRRQRRRLPRARGVRAILRCIAKLSFIQSLLRTAVLSSSRSRQQRS